MEIKCGTIIFITLQRGNTHISNTGDTIALPTIHRNVLLVPTTRKVFTSLCRFCHEFYSFCTFDEDLGQPVPNAVHFAMMTRLFSLGIQKAGVLLLLVFALNLLPGSEGCGWGGVANNVCLAFGVVDLSGPNHSHRSPYNNRFHICRNLL